MAVRMGRSSVVFLYKFPLIQGHALGSEFGLGAILSRSRYYDQSCHECFLDIGKAKGVGDFRNGHAQLVREVDILISALLELGLPEVAIMDSLLQIGVGEEELAIEPARSFRDPRIQAFEVVGAADHQYAVVGLHAIDFVEKEGAHAVGHEGIEVFKDEVAWCFLAGFAEDFPERKLGRDKAIAVCRRQRNCVAQQFFRRYSNGHGGGVIVLTLRAS